MSVRQGGAWIACLFGPVIVVAAIAVAWVGNRINDRQLTSLADELESLGVPLTDAAMTRLYDESTHRDATDSLARASAIAQRVRSVFGYPAGMVDQKQFDSEDSLANILAAGDDWAAKPIVDRLVRESEALVAELDAIADAPQPIWQPIVYQGEYTINVAYDSSRAIVTVLSDRITHHAIHGDGDAATADLKRMLFIGDATQIAISPFGVWEYRSNISKALGLIDELVSTDVWSTTQLTQVRSLIDEPFPLEAIRRGSMIGSINAFITDNGIFAPSNRVGSGGEWVVHRGMTAGDREALVRYQIAALRKPVSLDPASVTNIHTRRHDNNNARGGPFFTIAQAKAKPEPDINDFVGVSLNSVPTSSMQGQVTFQRLDHGDLITRALIALECERRMTTTAIACKQFWLENERWPKSLSDLDLPAGTTTGVGGKPFGVAVDGDEFTLWMNPNVMLDQRRPYQPDELEAEPYRLQLTISGKPL